MGPSRNADGEMVTGGEAWVAAWGDERTGVVEVGRVAPSPPSNVPCPSSDDAAERSAVH